MRKQAACRPFGTASLQANSFSTFVLGNFQKGGGGGRGKKSLFSWNHSERNIIQSPVWDCLAKIMEISVIVWGRQTLGRWQAAGKYRWRRQPEGQYSLLYNLSQAALNYFAEAGTAAGAPGSRRRLTAVGGGTIEGGNLGGMKTRRGVSSMMGGWSRRCLQRDASVFS